MAANTMTYKGYSGSVEPSIEDECLHGRILLIDDMITYEGSTVPEIVASFHAAVDRYIDYCTRTGKSPNKAYSGVFQTRIDPELHREAARAATKRNIKLNEFVSQAICSAVNSDGPTKIEHIHQVNLTVSGVANQETLMATAGVGSTWKPVNATLQ